MKSGIESVVGQAILRLQERTVWSVFDIPEIQVDRPKDSAHGDWMTNVSFVIAKKIQKKPKGDRISFAGKIVLYSFVVARDSKRSGPIGNFAFPFIKVHRDFLTGL